MVFLISEKHFSDDYAYISKCYNNEILEMKDNILVKVPASDARSVEWA